MSELYVISDTHFGHAKTIDFANRPFKTVEEMDETIISLWNLTVHKKDTIIHLGDWGLNTRSYKIAERLNGFKRLILGNHDQFTPDLLKYFKSIHGSLRKYECLLAHYPVYKDYAENYKYMIHGHIHDSGKTPYKDWRYYNVTMDVLKYYGPISFEEIRSEMNRREFQQLYGDIDGS